MRYNVTHTDTRTSLTLLLSHCPVLALCDYKWGTSSRAQTHTRHLLCSYHIVPCLLCVTITEIQLVSSGVLLDHMQADAGFACQPSSGITGLQQRSAHPQSTELRGLQREGKQKGGYDWVLCVLRLQKSKSRSGDTGKLLWRWDVLWSVQAQWTYITQPSPVTCDTQGYTREGSRACCVSCALCILMSVKVFCIPPGREEVVRVVYLVLCALSWASGPFASLLEEKRSCVSCILCSVHSNERQGLLYHSWTWRGCACRVSCAPCILMSVRAFCITPGRAS